jgi:hypothetical protein
VVMSTSKNANTFISISLIEIMGLIGDNCRPCLEAAEADGGHGGGLAGKWWRGWAKVAAILLEVFWDYLRPFSFRQTTTLDILELPSLGRLS